MTEHRSERPPRLVTTCAYLGVIGAFQVLQVIIVLTGWYSESGEEQVKRFTDPLVKDGVNRGDAETIYRVYLAILAILAASVLVFAVYTALGHAVSRIMLTITAPLMALLGITQGSFVSILLSVVTLTCVLQLWNADVRQWFARLAGHEAPTTAPVAASGWPPPVPPTPAEQGAPPAQQQWAPHPQAYAPPRPKAPTDVVKVLSLITLIGSSVVAAGCAFYLLMYEFARDELVRQQLDSGMNWMNLSEAEVRDSYHDLAVMSWVVLPLCVVAIGVSAVLLVRRRRRS
jgi:hypothetical protein